MTDERSLWEQATESSYWADHGEERPGPLPMPRRGEPTWRPAAAAPPPRTVAGGSGFLELDELAFEQTSSTDMVVRDAGGDIVGHVNRRPRLEERGFLTPRVMVLEATGPDGPVDLLHITDPRSMGGTDYDATLPDGTPVARITGIRRWFRLNLAIRAEVDDLLSDGDLNCSLVHVFRDVGQPAKKAGEGPTVASISRESMGLGAYFLSRYRYRLRIEPGVDRATRLALAATVYAVSSYRHKDTENQ